MIGSTDSAHSLSDSSQKRGLFMPSRAIYGPGQLKSAKGPENAVPCVQMPEGRDIRHSNRDKVITLQNEQPTRRCPVEPVIEPLQIPHVFNVLNPRQEVPVGAIPS